VAIETPAANPKMGQSNRAENATGAQELDSIRGIALRTA
jgi:hypothetical protein